MNIVPNGHPNHNTVRPLDALQTSQVELTDTEHFYLKVDGRFVPVRPCWDFDYTIFRHYNGEGGVSGEIICTRCKKSLIVEFYEVMTNE